MSMGSGMGPVWRHMRTDRSVADQKLHRDTLRRVVGFARPHRRIIGVFAAHLERAVLQAFDRVISGVDARAHPRAAHVSQHRSRQPAAEAGMPCPVCGTAMQAERAIEIGCAPRS